MPSSDWTSLVFHHCNIKDKPVIIENGLSNGHCRERCSSHDCRFNKKYETKVRRPIKRGLKITKNSNDGFNVGTYPISKATFDTIRRKAVLEPDLINHPRIMADKTKLDIRTVKRTYMIIDYLESQGVLVI